jgi:hypothetical protein
MAPASRGRSGACVVAAGLDLGRHPAAVLASLPARCAFAVLGGVLARVLRSPRAGRRTGTPTRRAADPGPPAHPAQRRIPASGPVLSSVPTAVRTVPPVSRPAGEALQPVRVRGHSGVSDITLGRATVESNLYAQLQGSCTLGRNIGCPAGPHVNISQFENTDTSREYLRDEHRPASGRHQAAIRRTVNRILLIKWALS